jgi:hypothetical protein
MLLWSSTPLQCTNVHHRYSGWCYTKAKLSSQHGDEFAWGGEESILSSMHKQTYTNSPTATYIPIYLRWSTLNCFSLHDRQFHYITLNTFYHSLKLMKLKVIQFGIKVIFSIESTTSIPWHSLKLSSSQNIASWDPFPPERPLFHRPHSWTVYRCTENNLWVSCYDFATNRSNMSRWFLHIYSVIMILCI